MSKIIKYKYVQSFFIDNEGDKVIESRHIKRIYIMKNEEEESLSYETKTQFLKSKSKRYNLSEVSKTILDALLKESQGSLQTDIEQEEFVSFMEPSFNLFELKSLF